MTSSDTPPQDDLDALDPIRTFLRIGLFVLILTSPLPFGSVQPWSVLTIEVYSAALGIGASWVLFRDPSHLSRPVKLVFASSAALLAIGCLQLVPMPESWVATLSAPTAELRASIYATVEGLVSTSSSLTLSPPDTLDALLRLASYVILGITAFVSVRTDEHFKQFAVVIVVSGLFQAVYGGFEYLSGRQHIFGYAKQYYLEQATGTFINRNHFAGYLAMTLPFALGLLSPQALPRFRSLSWRQRLVGLADPAALIRVFSALAVFSIWCGIVLSYSRAGLAVAIAATIFVAISMFQRRRAIRLLALALVIPTCFLMYQDINAPGARMATLGDDLARDTGRLAAWKATSKIAADHILTGTGYGTFEKAFLRYRPPSIRKRWRNAHNDWLEALATGGIATPLLFALILFIVLRPVRTRFLLPAHSQVIATCAAAGIAAVALHSVVDFCLRIPAIAVLAACLVGIRLSLDAPLYPTSD